MTPNLHLLAADAVLVIHFAWVAFVVVGLPMVWFGAWRGWRWVRSFGFRLTHLLAMGYVTWEAVTGRDCPLTVWEDRLRVLGGGGAYGGSFLQHWLHRLLFYEFSATSFLIAYGAFLALILGTLWLVPPRVPWVRHPPPRTPGNEVSG